MSVLPAGNGDHVTCKGGHVTCTCIGGHVTCNGGHVTYCTCTLCSVIRTICTLKNNKDDETNTCIF